jgi:hypothetical protein
MATQPSFLDEDRVHRLPVQIPLEKGEIAKTKTDMWELSGYTAAETLPRAEASTRPFSGGRKSQLVNTSSRKAAVNGEQNPCDVHPESVQSTYNLRYNQQISGAKPCYVYNDIYYLNMYVRNAQQTATSSSRRWELEHDCSGMPVIGEYRQQLGSF